MEATFVKINNHFKYPASNVLMIFCMYNPAIKFCKNELDLKLQKFLFKADIGAWTQNKPNGNNCVKT